MLKITESASIVPRKSNMEIVAYSIEERKKNIQHQFGHNKAKTRMTLHMLCHAHSS